MSAAFSISPENRCLLRALEPDDWNFIYATWTNSSAANLPIVVESAHARAVRQGWALVSNSVLNALKSQAEFVVACKADEPGLIFGWAATIDGEPLYRYVSKGFRRRGIGRALGEWQKEQEQ